MDTPERKVVFRVHAVQRMFARGISRDDVRDVLESGETIEDYPDDTPYPSRLILGFRGSRPLHVVAADNPSELETIVITVHEPDADRWDTTFRRRKTS